ncbi:putative Retrotransposon hot spot protein [Trypanosoma vivax]|nr:putative Retrotransposon hot spot protein [Trypanosoma vivax]
MDHHRLQRVEFPGAVVSGFQVGMTATAGRCEQKRENADVQAKWSYSDSLESALPPGCGNPETVLLRNFLRTYLPGEALSYADSQVTMTTFMREPARYISDERLLGKILGLEQYRITQLWRDVRALKARNVVTFNDWNVVASATRRAVSDATRTLLDEALGCASRSRPGPQVSDEHRELAEERLRYHTVYNASWSFVESGHASAPMGMIVVDTECVGEPPRMWEEREVDFTPSPGEADAVVPGTDGGLELLVLISEWGWPLYSFMEETFAAIVRREVVRAWNILKRGIDNRRANGGTSPRRLYSLLGTPGIGKTAAVGLLFLHQLLHCSPDTIGAVLYVVREHGYVFFKLGSRAGTAKDYRNVCDALAVVNELADEGVQGCAIYDCWSKLEDMTNLPIGTWDVVVFNAPDVEIFYKIEEQTIVNYILFNGYNMRELMALHAWDLHKRGSGFFPILCSSDLSVLEAHAETVGPVPRYLRDEDSYNYACSSINQRIQCFPDDQRDFLINTLLYRVKWLPRAHVYYLLKIVRVKHGVCEHFVMGPCSSAVEIELRRVLLKDCYYLRRLMWRMVWCPETCVKLFEMFGVCMLLYRDVSKLIVKKLTCLPRACGCPRDDAARRVTQVYQFPTERRIISCGVHDKPNATQMSVETDVLYIPDLLSFPLFSAFYFTRDSSANSTAAGCRRKRDGDSQQLGSLVLVGVLATSREGGATPACAVVQFTERMAECFDDWNVVRGGLRWVVVYFQHHSRAAMVSRQECVVSEGAMSEEDCENVRRLWDEAEQQQVRLDEEIIDALLAHCGRRAPLGLHDALRVR